MGRPWSLAALVLLIGEAAQAQAPLSISLQSGNFNGYQVACFGKQTGVINATISGGTAPYQYSWSNGATNEDLSGLPAGYYALTVVDADSTVATAGITLTEPTPMVLVAEPYTYPNGYNVSCYECYNGSIDVTVSQGVPPYTYLWNDSTTTTQDRSGLGGKKYFVVVRDANNCWLKSETMMLTQPERDTWSKNGDGGTNPSTQYFGTPDNKDVVFKSNGQERLRLKGNGKIGLWGTDTLQIGPLYRDTDGTLKVGGGPEFPTYPVNEERCTPLAYTPFWKTAGNFLAPCPGDPIPKLGTINEADLRLVTNDQTRILVTAGGKIGIGTSPPNIQSSYLLFVEGGIATRDVQVKLGTWPDYVFRPNYALMPLDELRVFLKRNKHLPGIPSAAELQAQGGVELGDMQRKLVQVVEEQALYILQLEERQAQMEQRLHALETQTR